MLRACPLDAFAFPSSDDQRASACPASSTAMTQQATRNRWTRPRAKGPSRGDGSLVAEEQHTRKAAPTNRQPNQARRSGQRLDHSFGQTQSRHQGQAEEPQRNHAQGRPQDAPDDARLFFEGVRHSADQGVEPRSRHHAETDSDLRRIGTARGARTHSRTTIRVGISGLDQISAAEVQHCRHENGTWPIDILGPIGTFSSDPKFRRGSILQSGHNVQTGHQEHLTERRVAKKTIVCSRSTPSNRRRAQVLTSIAHGNGTRGTSVSRSSVEDVTIMLKAFTSERSVQANSKAWHNAMQSDDRQRMAIAHAQRLK